MTKRLAAIAASLFMSLAGVLAVTTAPASAGTVPIKASAHSEIIWTGNHWNSVPIKAPGGAPAAACKTCEYGHPSTRIMLEPPPSSCASVSVCMYVNISFRTDQGYEIAPSRPAGTCEQTAFGNSISSLWNSSGRTVRFYKSTGCTGDYLTYYNGTGHQQLSVSHPTFENRINSYKFI